ncbi:hypothetical protein [Streptomyces sp. YGL11-2]|uniref:hypothetical protein n=1 Tax=Streptomyces sp. YGL11-2 TaxID=3414028 RepID=UPI003CF7CB60
MTRKTGMHTMNENELKTSAAGQGADVFALIREMTAMAGRLSEEIRAVREDVAELRKNRGPA